MDRLLADFPWYKKIFFRFASMGLYPTIISAIGYAYISVPSNLQLTIRRSVPIIVREHLLRLYNVDKWTLILFFISVGCAIWAGLGSHITVRLTKDKYRKIYEENDQLKQDCESKSIDTYKFLSDRLASYSSKLSISDRERISLYKLELNLFYCIGRYSPNNAFKIKPDRLYPKDQGCIGLAWERGVFHNSDSPDPGVDLDEWAIYHSENFHLEKEELLKIQMKSRELFSCRINNSERETIAVLVIESLDSKKLNIKKINSILSINEITALASIIEALERHIPSLEMAHSEGF